MKILIFGKTGQVAFELSNALSDLHEITFLGRDDLDLSYPNLCKKKILDYSPDIIINAAAYTNVDKAESEEELASRINGYSPAEMALASSQLNIPMIQISTDYVFSGEGCDSWNEESPTDPLGAYGRSKLIGELAVLKASKSNIILRTSWIYSATGSNFLKKMIELSEDNLELSVVSDQIGAPTSARDIANAIVIIAESVTSKRREGGVYHFASNGSLSWADFARKIFSETGKETQVKDILSCNYPTKAKRPKNSRLNCLKILNHYGIAQPQWDESLLIVLNQLKKKNEK